MRPFIASTSWFSAFVVLLSGCASPPMQTSAPNGKALYVTYCVSCHGDTGANDRQGANRAMRLLDANTLSDLAWNAIIEKGRGEMPAFHDRLTPEEIQSLHTYIQSLKNVTGR